VSGAFDAIGTDEDLVAWSRSYCKRARREWGVDVRFDLVDWRVSHRAKRRAAAVEHPKLPGATVGDPYDWETVDGADGRPLPCTVALTWDACAAFDRDEWAATLRHELIHVEQYQHSGTTDHGAAFEERAADLDTGVHCPRFAEPAYVLRCTDCDGVVARRYRDCKLVRNRERYRSDCCGAALSLQ